MRDLWKAFVDFFVSLKLTVTLLVLSMFLVFFATLDQTSLGIYAVQEKWFRSLVVIHFVSFQTCRTSLTPPPGRGPGLW